MNYIQIPRNDLVNIGKGTKENMRKHIKLYRIMQILYLHNKV